MTVTVLPHPQVAENLGVFNLNTHVISDVKASDADVPKITQVGLETEMVHQGYQAI